MHETELVAHNVSATLGHTQALDGVSVEIPSHQLTLITGPSGSGKTTLLNVMSGILKPNEGSVFHHATEITGLPQEALTEWRARVGRVYQRSGLLAGLTVYENIKAPHEMNRNPIEPAWAKFICRTLGVDDLLHKRAGGLSGGQAQRVAMARAFLHKPDIVFADEPTASLDQASKAEIHQLMRGLVDEEGAAIVLVSHETPPDFADTVITLQDGRLVDNAVPADAPTPFRKN